MSEAPRPFRINRYPRGLIPLLNSKAEGTTPHVMAPEVFGGIDLTKFYELETPLQVNGQLAAAMNASGGIFSGVGNIVCPQGEIWRVTGCGLYMNALAAGTTYTISLAMRLIQTGTAMYIGLDGPKTWTAAQNAIHGWTGDMFWQAGDTLAGICHTFVAGTAVNPTMYVVGTRYTL